MEKLVVKTATKTVLIILGIFIVVFAVFNFAFPQHMATATESIGNYSIAVKYAELRYNYTKSADDLARCFEDSVLLGKDEYVLKHGEPLIDHTDYSAVCEKKNRQYGGSNYDYDRWVKSKLAVSYYNTDNVAKAILLAKEKMPKDENGNLISFPYGNAYMSLASRIKGYHTGEEQKARSAAEEMLKELEKVAPQEQTEKIYLAEVKKAMEEVIANTK